MKLSEQFLERVSNSTKFSKPVVLTKHMKIYGEICMLEGKIEEANRIDTNLFEIDRKGKSRKMHDFISGFRAVGIYRGGLELWEQRLEEIKLEHELK